MEGPRLKGARTRHILKEPQHLMGLRCRSAGDLAILSCRTVRATQPSSVRGVPFVMNCFLHFLLAPSRQLFQGQIIILKCEVSVEFCSSGKDIHPDDTLCDNFSQHSMYRA